MWRGPSMRGTMLFVLQGAKGLVSVSCFNVCGCVLWCTSLCEGELWQWVLVWLSLLWHMTGAVYVCGVLRAIQRVGLWGCALWLCTCVCCLGTAWCSTQGQAGRGCREQASLLGADKNMPGWRSLLGHPPSRYPGRNPACQGQDSLSPSTEQLRMKQQPAPAQGWAWHPQLGNVGLRPPNTSFSASQGSRCCPRAQGSLRLQGPDSPAGGCPRPWA